ncbi:carnitine O-palmitoyltransferase 1 [Strigomonas culicis]|uniref:Carnitine O-palmitoyltransferase 1 n=1 Tax=Strigomonas culicis TaxID=28005 RepID=S9U6G9_9TRYP|nr:carnitine O-palmitoyltransferase 1 [Strigomonas culicis]|eukprot:EPY24379.1 carnitine O-palmitoyltransferase 1 [Strigomonas culicis]
MAQYHLAFRTTRVPGRECDLVAHGDRAEADYIVVLVAGRIYQVPLYRQRSRRALTPRMLLRLFEWLIADAAEDELSTGRDSSEEESDGESADDTHTKRRSYRIAESLLPALTTAPRAVWADARTDFLLNDASNHRPLHTIENALFVVALDDGGRAGGAEGLSASCASYLCGNGSNRWCDKSFNLVVRADGEVGAHVEHSWCDLSSFTALFGRATAAEEGAYDDDGLPRALPGDRPDLSAAQWEALQPRRLRFRIHKSLAHSIRAAHTAFLTDVASQLDLHVRRLGGYGAGLPRHYGCSPRAWVQLAVQLAYYVDQRYTLSQVYESVPMRSFLKGRTETLRGVGEASCRFVRAMTARDAAGELTDECSAAEKRDALLTACRAHEQTRREAACGDGIDRHLFALYMVSAGKQIPSDFITAVLRRTRWHVSLAEAPPQQGETPGCGFGPVAPDGYGVAYSFVGDGALYVTVTAEKGCGTTSAAALADRIEAALQTMADVMAQFDDA